MNLRERNEKVREFFNGKIDSYDDVHAEYMDTKATLGDNLDNNAKNILDLGGGTGLELIHLFELHPDVHVTVIDITENMVEKLKLRDFADKVTAICGDFFEVDFGKNFDAVISTSALHHFKKEEKIILYKKIFDCLKENGQFLNSDFIAENEEIEKEQLYELDNEFDKYKHIDIPMTIEHELEVLEKVGFKDIKVKPVPKHSYALTIARK
ncbi:MAG: class I SAM-dependent methyltransferase [Bacilli bacterium]|nr:class I SAM-dependent methyltransferase [Bacilli bacterium]